MTTFAYAEPGSWCLNGWKSPKPCGYTGGCYCERDAGHRGRCRCVCGSTSTTKPPSWSDAGIGGTE